MNNVIVKEEVGSIKKIIFDNSNSEANRRKRGRRKKGESIELTSNKDQNKYFIDVFKDPENKELVLNLLAQANNKEYGREIYFKDIVFAALPKLTTKDIEKLQELSLSEMEKVQRALDEFNKKNNQKLSLGEFLVKRLGIN